MNARGLAVSMAAGALLAALLPGALHHGPAGAQAPSPSPGSATPVTPVPTPKAGSVLDSMMRAWQAAGSDHFTLVQQQVTVTRASRTTVNGTGTGDVDWRQNPPLFQMVGPDSVVKVTRSGKTVYFDREVQLYAENLLAVRIGTHKWSCDRFFGYSALPGSPQWDETSPWGIPGKNLGMTTVDGVPAWHVRLSLTTRGPKGSKKPPGKVVRDYFAATATYLPIRIRLSGEDTSKGEMRTYSTTLTLSRFGETFHVTLPRACSTK